MLKSSNAVMAGLLAAGIAGFFAAGEARAAVVPGVTIQSFSSQLDQNYNRHASYIVDGSGLDINGPGTHSTDPSTMWETTGAAGCCGGTSNNGPNNQDASPYIIFNLGGTYTLESMRVWNYNEPSWMFRGIKTADVSFSADNITYGATVNKAFNQAPGTTAGDFSQVIPISGTGAYVKFSNIISNDTDNGLVGLSEIRFNSVPEPASLGILGVCGLGLLVRRGRP